MSKNSTKQSALQKLRRKERQRRMVPPVVLRRRIAAHTQLDDPGTGVLTKARRLSGKHARELRSLVIRSKGLLDAHEAVSRRFAMEGLDEMGLDSRAKALINNSISKISEIMLFKLVSTELVNDNTMRDKMVELFLHQRFDSMVTPVPKTKNTPNSNVPPRQPEPAVPHREQELMSLLHRLMDT